MFFTSTCSYIIGSSNPKDTSSQGERAEPVVDRAFYGETKEANSRAQNVVVWNNQGREGFVKSKSRQRDANIGP